MKHLLFPIIVFFSCIGLFSQENSKIIVDIPTTQKPWNHIDWNNNPDNFQFAIVSDRTGGHRPGIFSVGINKLNLLQPEFVMSVGDLIEGYTEDQERLDAEWKEFNGFIDELTVPFFYVPGNHDITNKVMEEKWQELFGVTYYHFRYKDVLFLCLNSEDNYRGAGKGTIDEEQYKYIEKTLEKNKDVKWTLVFLHQPLWVQQNTKRWKDVEKLLENRPHNVFAGHYHRYWKSERNNGKYIALATTGGGSRLRGTRYGEFDHVVWVTMTEEGPLLANLFLDGIWDENVVTDEIVELVRNKPSPIEIEPVYFSDIQAAQVSTNIRITNDSDFPMKVKMVSKTHPYLFLKMDQSALEIAPNDVTILNLEIANFKRADLSKVVPIEINSEISYQYTGNTDVVFDQKIQFAPTYKNPISKATSTITVDGKFSDWEDNWEWIPISGFKGKPFDYRGEKDFKMSFNSIYDKENLYLAVQISDDEIFHNAELQPWSQDMVAIALDARPPEQSYFNNGRGSGKSWLPIFLNFNEEKPIQQRQDLPDDLEYSFTKHSGGVNLELSIPISYLDKMQMHPWTSFRLGIGYIDFDEKGESKSEHYWYPAWSSPDSFHGSGMFFKSE